MAGRGYPSVHLECVCADRERERMAGAAHRRNAVTSRGTAGSVAVMLDQARARPAGARIRVRRGKPQRAHVRDVGRHQLVHRASRAAAAIGRSQARVEPSPRRSGVAPVDWHVNAVREGLRIVVRIALNSREVAQRRVKVRKREHRPRRLATQRARHVASAERRAHVDASFEHGGLAAPQRCVGAARLERTAVVIDEYEQGALPRRITSPLHRIHRHAEAVVDCQCHRFALKAIVTRVGRAQRRRGVDRPRRVPVALGSGGELAAACVVGALAVVVARVERFVDATWGHHRKEGLWGAANEGAHLVVKGVLRRGVEEQGRRGEEGVLGGGETGRRGEGRREGGVWRRGAWEEGRGGWQEGRRVGGQERRAIRWRGHGQGKGSELGAWVCVALWGRRVGGSIGGRGDV